ncbi:MAG: hypothetical protein J6Y92_04840 [Lentisphaeria bacterium]|nr:hypothetical protein [Lentisphaeria bacterium]
MKYERPTHLSDPGGDFSPEELNRILSKTDAELDWADFDRLFFGKMPAGTYEEVRYYIPLACDYLENQRDACTFFEHLSIWIEDNYARLKEDGLLDPIISAFHALFRKATSSFDLEYNGDHAVYPSACDSVESVLEAMFRLSPACPEFRPDALFSELKENLDYIHAQWIVYIVTEMTMLSPEKIRTVLSASDYQKALAVLEENIDLILNDATAYEFWQGKI